MTIVGHEIDPARKGFVEVAVIVWAVLGTVLCVLLRRLGHRLSA